MTRFLERSSPAGVTAASRGASSQPKQDLRFPVTGPLLNSVATDAGRSDHLMSPATVLSLQRTAGNRAVATVLAGMPGSRPGAVRPAGPRRPGGVIQVSRRGRSNAISGKGPISEESRWGHAAAHVNLPMDSGHTMSWLLHEKMIMGATVKNKDEREEILDRAKVLEKNMYGRGKWGLAMRSVDTASRICHLIGMVSGILALACGVAGLFHPAVLPVGAIAGIVAMSAHGAMAILQSILVGFNAIRIQGLPPEERAKVMPTLIRDVVKLVFALVGVGLGAGGAAVAGMHGIMATTALTGVEQTMHIGMTTGEAVGEGAAGTGLFWGIGSQDYREKNLGVAGAFNDELQERQAKRQAKQQAKQSQVEVGENDTEGSEPPDPTGLLSTLETDSLASEEGMKEAGERAQGALDGTKGQKVEVDQLGDLTSSGPKLQDAVDQMDQATTGDKGTAPDPPDVAQKTKEVDKANDELDRIDGSGDKGQEAEVNGSGGQKKVKTRSSSGSGKRRRRRARPGTTSVQKMSVQRAGGNFFKRAGTWIASKLSPFGRKVKKLMARIKTKLVALTLKVLGLKETVQELDEGVAEKAVEAQGSVEALGDAKAASVDYRAAVDAFRSSVTTGSGRQ